MKLKLLFFLFVFQSALAANSGPNNEYSIIADLSDNWHVYNQKAEQFEVYISGISDFNPALTTFLDIQANKHFSLLIKSTGDDGHIFFNGSLYQKLKKGDWLVIPISQLTDYPSNLAITFYGSQNAAEKEILVGAKSNLLGETTTVKRDNLLHMKSRVSFPFSNTILLLFAILILFISTIISINPKAFNEYYSFGDIFITNIRDTKFLVSKPLNQVNIAFVVLLSFITSLLYILLVSQNILLFQEQLNISVPNSNLAFILLFLKAFAICFTIYYLKYFFLNITGNLFGLGKSVNIHYFKIIQFNLFFFLLLIFVIYAIAISSVSHSFQYSMALTYAAITLYALRTLIVHFTILKSTGIQSLYLFAYLCVVEILPIFIGIRFAF